MERKIAAAILNSLTASDTPAVREAGEDAVRSLVRLGILTKRDGWERSLEDVAMVGAYQEADYYAWTESA